MTDLVECLRKQGRHDIADEIERLRAQIIKLEAEVAVAFGALATRYLEDCARYTHNVAPNAPPHNEE